MFIKLVKTKDGSYTAYNKAADEHYHTITGAIEEAFEKHVNSLGIENGMQILDFCFGLGYNSIAACKDHSDLKITGLENDIEIIRTMEKIEILEILNNEYEAFRKLYISLDITDNSNNRIKILLGDALEKIDDLPQNNFDRVFFDPFSPGKQPEMWSEQVFHKLYNKMKKGAKLSTYSCAKWIRENMQNAGFQVLDGPIVGRKSPATIAIK